MLVLISTDHLNPQYRAAGWQHIQILLILYHSSFSDFVAEMISVVLCFCFLYLASEILNLLDLVSL